MSVDNTKQCVTVAVNSCWCQLCERHGAVMEWCFRKQHLWYAAVLTG